jgi:glycine cleavage system H protein
MTSGSKYVDARLSRSRSATADERKIPEMQFDPTCRYLPTHEWVRVLGDEAVIGISDFAQSELNDVVYVELPEVGDSVEKGEEFGSVESVKAASELYAPVSGEVIAVNQDLEVSPELVNQSPFDQGWMIRMKLMAPGELDELLDVDAYQALCEQG